MLYFKGATPIEPFLYPQGQNFLKHHFSMIFKVMNFKINTHVCLNILYIRYKKKQCWNWYFTLYNPLKPVLFVNLDIIFDSTFKLIRNPPWRLLKASPKPWKCWQLSIPHWLHPPPSLYLLWCNLTHCFKFAFDIKPQM